MSPRNNRRIPLKTKNHLPIYELVASMDRKIQCTTPNSALRARGTVSMATVIRIFAFASTPVIHKVCRRIDFNVRHALGLVAVTPVASFTHIPQGLDHLLLGPNRVALAVVPRAHCCIRCGKAVLVVQRITGFDSEFDPFNIDAYVGADGFAPGLAELRPHELAHLASGCPGAIPVA